MSKDELINFIKEIEERRAFTYEDQMKLAFIDSSPFTLWASDRNCKIKFWSGKCERLYGYTKEEVIEKDFVDLFVASDEQKAAREDQISIIDDGAIFHNIANDVGKSGNTLRLLTNCWRLKDPKTGEFWNAEMGLIIDFYNQEVERLETIINESRMLKSKVTEFIGYSKRCKIQFSERKRSINKAIRECDRKAVLLRKRTEFQKRIKEINCRLSRIEININGLIEEYLTKMKCCGSSSECDTLIENFKEEYGSILFKFEDLVTDFQEISLDYDDNSGVVHGKDAILKYTATLHETFFEKAFVLKNIIEQTIEDYKCLEYKKRGSSKILDEYVQYREQISAIINKINSIDEEMYEKVNNVKSEIEIIEIRKTVQSDYDKIAESLETIEKSMKGEESEEVS